MLLLITKGAEMGSLCECREQRGLTQQQLADLVGINRSAIAHFEAGRIKPSLPVAFAIARILNFTIEEMFGDAETATSPETPQEALSATLTEHGTAPTPFPASENGCGGARGGVAGDMTAGEER